MKAFLDTHAVVALGEGKRSTFGIRSLDLLDRSALFFAPVVRLELRFLEQIGRIKAPAAEVVSIVHRESGVRESQDAFGAVVDYAIAIDWTRDPFDLFIVATAMLHRAPLITKDGRIHDHYSDAVW